ncbi:unnamed protein product [Tetraodon nigroviridis]|uniref:(spotted green pufferfish) hypothetical protein n=1 Tax=Tetraodon nigroviridis TaxID=99883 RepID=Q4T410_TETNG|nr:unnamed protein product [Tetraodon nigroviridis]
MWRDMGVTPKLDKDQRDAKSILEHIFFHLVEFKKLNQGNLRCGKLSLQRHGEHIHAPDVKQLRGEKIVLAWPTETEGNVRLGARVRSVLCLAKILAGFGGLITLDSSLTVMAKVTMSLRRVLKKLFLA